MAKYNWPLSTIRQTQGFGENAAYYAKYGQKGHNGLDLGVPVGTPVYASRAGTINFEGWGQNNSWMGKVAGIAVIIDHGDVYTGYAHLSKTVVNKGQSVAQGQLIGYSGATGGVTGPHLHFEFIGKPIAFNNGYAGRLNPSGFAVGQETTNPGNGGNNVPVKITMDAWRQLAHGILGRNGVAGRQNALNGSSDADGAANHVGKDLTVEYLQGLFLSGEARDWRDSASPSSINGINDRLSRTDILQNQLNQAQADRDEAKSQVQKLIEENSSDDASIAVLKQDIENKDKEIANLKKQLDEATPDNPGTVDPKPEQPTPEVNWLEAFKQLLKKIQDYIVSLEKK